MSESIERAHAAPNNVKVAFLQGLFESSGIVNARSKAVWVPVGPSYLNHIIRLLKDVGASPHVVGTEPVMVAVDAAEAARIPLFNPDVKSKKYQEVTALTTLSMT
jgi:hypothetical protein